jgi:hypothetical protein
LERYFSVLSGSRGGGYLDIGSSRSGRNSRVVEIISMRVVVAVEEGGDYLDTSSSRSSSSRVSEDLLLGVCPVDN